MIIYAKRIAAIIKAPEVAPTVFTAEE